MNRHTDRQTDRHTHIWFGLGVGYYSARVAPLHLGGQAARSPVPVLERVKDLLIELS